jgi:hypothetical protein
MPRNQILIVRAILMMINSLTAKSCSGKKNEKLPLGRLFASYTQSHKHPHHDGAVSPSSAMVLMDEHPPTPGASLEGVGQGRYQRV